MYTALVAARAWLVLGLRCPPSSLLSAQNGLDPTGPPPPGRWPVTLVAGLVCQCLVPTAVGTLREGLMACGSLSPHPQYWAAPEKAWHIQPLSAESPSPGTSYPVLP